MNDLQIFKSNEFGEIRTVLIDNEPWFVANDVAKALGYTNPSKATNDHCKRAVMRWGNDSLGRRQEFKVIPEGDMYRLITHSKLPSAERFESWIFDEVLPSIRKHGGYIAGQEKLSDDELLAKALLVAQSKIAEKDRLLAEKQKHIELMKPKEVFADSVAASRQSILIGDLAKLICQNGYQIGQKRLFQWMRDNGYLMVQGSSYNRPKQKYVEQGLFEIKESTINNPDGSVRVTLTTKVSGKGQIFFINKFLGDKNDSKRVC